VPPRDGPRGSINVPDQCRLFDSASPRPTIRVACLASSCVARPFLFRRPYAGRSGLLPYETIPDRFACLRTQKRHLVTHNRIVLFFMCCRDHPQPSPVLLQALCRKLSHTSHGDDYPLSPELSSRYPNTACRSRSFDGTKLFFGSCSPIHCPVFIVARP
jgi:hypothetical protein